MEHKLKMELMTDTIFGNGMSVPGGEDISVLTDEEGFPYFKGGTFKGIFREELENLIAWKQDMGIDITKKLGTAGDDSLETGKLRFHDFEISQAVKSRIKVSVQNKNDILEAFSYLRTFTKIDEESGIVEDGTLRSARCIKAGITFYGAIECEEEELSWIREVLGLIKWIGTMRNRGFGEVRIEVI